MRRALLLASVLGCVSVLASACLDRPVTATEPRTSNLYVEPIRTEVVEKLDLLFMMDNSQSMGDKQRLFAEAVPELVNRLVVPRCVGKGAVQKRASVDEKCPDGMQPEFRAVRDIHVAVITSSLGGHGGIASPCDATAKGHPDDRALLLPSVRPDLASYEGSGFLAWDPDRQLTPAGEANAATLGTQFGAMVEAAGENGCGYESSLEAWYRFLIDPEPPKSVVVQDNRSVPMGVDEQLLAQRRAFLRPDSLVAIVMLTDENDCSIRDEAQGFYLSSSTLDPIKKTPLRMPRANSACDRDPNDACCAPCQLGALQGCPSVADDPACKLGHQLTASEDTANTRCLENKRRFGYDFLYPTSRYVDGLTKRKVPSRSTGEPVDNPLFAPGPNGQSRDVGLVYLAGIVGVPWQDIADDASLSGNGLRYLTARQLSERSRWDVLVGDSAKNTPPSDPFMRESLLPRSGANPITGDRIASETSLNPRENAINGHEQKPNDTDLQLACTFRLLEPQPCAAGETCDCEPPDPENPENSPGNLANNSPLCQPPGGGAPQPTQYFGKAYPGLRPLEVLKGIGDSAIVASICPKVLEPGKPGYGYEPAVDALVDRLRDVLNGRCLPRPLAVASNASGELPCVVVEAAAVPAGDTCQCNLQSRSPASNEASALVRSRLKERFECDAPDKPSCASLCLCELAQSTDEALDACLNDVQGPDKPGYCYVHPFGESPSGNAALVANCDEGKKQLLRFVGKDTPRPGATAIIACLGATLH